MNSDRIYITGLNGTEKQGLGLYLKEEYGFDVISLNDEFNQNTFEYKIKIITEKIPNAKIVIATSFGAYLYLNSLITNNSNINVLLLSPVLGISFSQNGGRLPPNLSKFIKSIKSKGLNIPDNIKIISGSEDKICATENIDFFKKFYPHIEVNLIKNQGLL